MAILVKDYIIRLQVPVYDVSFVEILKCQQNLCRIDSGSILGEFSLSLKDLSQVTTLTVKNI